MDTAIKGCFVGLIAGAIALFLWHQADAYNAIQVRSAAQLSDIAAGTPVLVEGGVWAGDIAGMTVYVNETEHCTTHVSTDSKGKVSSSSSCDWNETGRNTPPFKVIVVEHGQQVLAIPVRNMDYRITGVDRRQSTGWSTRLRGFQNGDAVLIVGTYDGQGVVASEVYGGTRSQYVGGWYFWAWAASIVSAICIVGGIAIGVLES